MKGLALDTNVAIEILNGNEKIIKNCLKYYPIFLPVTVCGELLYGAVNSKQFFGNILKYKNFIAECSVLNTTSAVAIEYAEIRHQLKKIGKPTPENDIWIAALCISYEIPLATNDKHFKNIESLELINI